MSSYVGISVSKPTPWTWPLEKVPRIFLQMVGLDGDLLVGFLRGGCSREGVFLGNPKDSVWEDWGSP